MKLQLVNTKILNVSLKRLEKKDTKRKKKFGLNVGNLFNPDNPKAFAVVFKLTLDNPEYDLSVNAVHWFEAEKEITEEVSDTATEEVKKFLKWLRKSKRNRPFNFEVIET